MRWLVGILFAELAFSQGWTAQDSHTTVSLRGMSAVSEKIVWSSGAGGTVLKTADGGLNWQASIVPGAEQLDFRGIRAMDENTAYVVSAGEGRKSRVYKTTNGGASWILQFTNPDAKGFFDAIAFWDRDRGIILGDPVDGQFAIFTTADGGKNWNRQKTPTALKDEGAFAASNTCLIVEGSKEAWFVTGGPGGARVFRSNDGGVTWIVAATPMRNDGQSAGIFSIAFSDAKHGVVVGGEYSKDKEDRGNVAVTVDGGRNWKEPGESRPGGFRSAVVFVPARNYLIATGTSGSDLSTDGGQSWKHFDDDPYNALAFAGNDVWAAGSKGRIARLAYKFRFK